MDVFDCIESRRSVRSYDKKDVPKELIAQILVAGTYAPSAGNVQEWEFIIVKDRKTKEKLFESALRQEQIREAPVIIVVGANLKKIGLKYRERGKNVYSLQDTAACVQNMLLAAHALGLGTCWIGAFDENKVSSAVQLPDEIRPMAMITVGFPLIYKKLPSPDRVSFERVSWQEKYGKELEWFMDYSKLTRFHWQPLDQQIEELSRRLKELKKEREELKEKESGFGNKLKKVFKKK